jgi:dTDP-N-acetylfucosamine:lipid II N-acetylfucosaminyltransferase
MINNKENYIHLFDDDKFIDVAIELIEEVRPNISVYYVLKLKPLEYVKSERVRCVKVVSEKDIELVVAEITEINPKAVFFHALDGKKQKIALKLSSKIVKIWLLWGYDLYANWPPFRNILFEKQTQSVLSKKRNHITVFFKRLILDSSFNNRSYKFLEKYKIKLPSKLTKVLYDKYIGDFYNAASQMDIFVPIVQTESVYILKMGLNPSIGSFAYGYMNENTLMDKALKRGNILVGNSGDPTNNHIDVFEKLKKINLGSRKVIVPINYGGSKEYVDKVIEKGVKYFGPNFEPILNFMSFHEYEKLVSNCSVFIFNHIRQQALGNILLAVTQGGLVFLNKRSPVTKFLRSKHFVNYTVDQINQRNLFNELSESEKKNNRKIFENEYSKTNVWIKINNLFDSVDSIKKD